MAHKHDYRAHPNPEWAETHLACTVCGLAVPKRVLVQAGIIRSAGTSGWGSCARAARVTVGEAEAERLRELALDPRTPPVARASARAGMLEAFKELVRARKEEMP